MPRRTLFENLGIALPVLRSALATGNVRLLRSLLGPAWRGMVRQEAKEAQRTTVNSAYPVQFDWGYTREFPEMAKLYEFAKTSQWNAQTDIDWSVDVDP